MSALKCDIVTPGAKLFSEDAYMVIVPGVEGKMGFLEGHMPLVSLLSDGVASVQREKEGSKQEYVVQGGYVEVTGSKVIILTDRARAVEDIDVARVREKLAAFEAELSEMTTEEARKTPLPNKVAWCKAQLRAVEK